MRELERVNLARLDRRALFELTSAQQRDLREVADHVGGAFLAFRAGWHGQILRSILARW